MDEAEFESGGHETEIAQAGGLYEELNAQGALYVDASAFESPRPYVAGFPQHIMTVNPNFLSASNIQDADGRPISISEIEERWVVLVPSMYASYESAIRSYFEEYRAASAPRSQSEVLGLEVPPHLSDQDVELKWIADGTRVFSFNPEVRPNDDHYVENPIIEVVTMRNSYEIDRMNVVTGDYGAAMKVVSLEDPSVTYQRLVPILERLRLDDNLTGLVSADAPTGDQVSQPISRWWQVLALPLYVALSFAITQESSRRAVVRVSLVWLLAVLFAYGYSFAVHPTYLSVIPVTLLLALPIAIALELAATRLAARARLETAM